MTQIFLLKPFALAAIVLMPLLSMANDEMITNVNDLRDYRYLKLENNLEVVLVSDPDAQTAAASLDVAVGHGSDPDDRAGMAHFLEHMLFLGTQKYPNSGEYQEFVRNNGGSHNAYTSYDHTNYFFKIIPEHFEPALDRFSQFFIAPLFNDDLIKQERVIVNSEFSARSRDEGRRSLAARRQLYNPSHPRSKFAVGNLSTLGDRSDSDIRKELVNFYNNHYSASVMKLAVIGTESLDELENLVRGKFSAIKNNNAKRFVSKAPLYRKGDLPAFLQIRPIKERRQVTFTFPIPSVTVHHESKPMLMISSMIGDESPGSLLSYLKNMGWAHGLSAGFSNMDSVQGEFTVAVSLTPAGLEQIETIGAQLFALIAQIKAHGVQKWRHDEMQKLAEIGFRYRPEYAPLSLVQTIASNLHDYAWHETLEAPYYMKKYDVKKIKSYLDKLHPNNLIVTIVDQEVETKHTTQWFETEYGISKVPEAWLESWRNSDWNSAIGLPEKNPFVPENLDFLSYKSNQTIPTLIKQNNLLEVWHHTDTEYKAPRANLYLSFRSSIANQSAKYAVLASLYTALVEEQLGEWSYPAYLAGLGYEIYPHQRGFSIRISGYTDKQPELLRRILTELKLSKIQDVVFDRVKQGFRQSYENQMQASPSAKAVSELRRLLLEVAWSPVERLQALESIYVDDISLFVDEFTSKGNIVVLSHGNRTLTQTDDLTTDIESYLLSDMAAQEVARKSVFRLPIVKQQRQEIRTEHPDSVSGLYFQGETRTRRERATFYMLDQLMAANFYAELRTEQKLGYIVQSSALPLMEVPGFWLMVQSVSTSHENLEKSMRDFLLGYLTAFDSLDDKVIDQAKLALTSEILEREAYLDDRTKRYWREIDRGENTFESRQHMVDAIESIKKPDIRNLLNKMVLGKLGELVIFSTGTGASHSTTLSSPDSLIIGKKEFNKLQTVF